ncbi:MAG: DUF4153 domain-containing protein, partial [Peptoniphilus lacydonensis]|nr:DUF4153 domain-containing protein [Peptoniphilus lacydonensis]
MRIFNYSLINFNSIKNTFKRFPLTIISAILATFFLIFWTFEKAEATNIKMLSYGIVFAFGIFLFSFISLFNEGLNNYYDLKNLKSNNLIKVLSY